MYSVKKSNLYGGNALLLADLDAVMADDLSFNPVAWLYHTQPLQIEH
jgi:hypothetical protein